MKDINDSNITQTVEIAKKFDTDLDVQVQSLLNIYTYQKYGIPYLRWGLLFWLYPDRPIIFRHSYYLILLNLIFSYF